MTFKKLLEMVTADVGIGGSATSPSQTQGDFYATGRADIPYVVGSKRKLFGGKSKVKRKKKNGSKNYKLW